MLMHEIKRVEFRTFIHYYGVTKIDLYDRLVMDSFVILSSLCAYSSPASEVLSSVQSRYSYLRVESPFTLGSSEV